MAASTFLVGSLFLLVAISVSGNSPWKSSIMLSLVALVSFGVDSDSFVGMRTRQLLPTNGLIDSSQAKHRLVTQAVIKFGLFLSSHSLLLNFNCTLEFSQ
jgi:hypothetical protein